MAMEERGERLRIFNINHGKAPTFARITLSLTETNDNTNDGVHVVNWLVDGINTQNDQWVFTAILILLILMPLRSKLRLEISNLPWNPTVKQQLKISCSHAYLVKDFLDRVSYFLPTIEETDLKPLDDELIDTPLEESVEPEEAMEVAPEEDLFYEDETQAPPFFLRK